MSQFKSVDTHGAGPPIQVPADDLDGIADFLAGVAAPTPADAERLALAERIERAHQVSIVETDQQRRLGAQSTLRPAETAMLVSSLRAGGWREDMQS